MGHLIPPPTHFPFFLSFFFPLRKRNTYQICETTPRLFRDAHTRRGDRAGPRGTHWFPSGTRSAVQPAHFGGGKQQEFGVTAETSSVRYLLIAWKLQKVLSANMLVWECMEKKKNLSLSLGCKASNDPKSGHLWTSDASDWAAINSKKRRRDFFNILIIPSMLHAIKT